MLLDDAMSLPRPLLGFEFDQEVYGSDWGRYYLQFNTGAYTRIGIAVCDMGGEALIDNLRLFKSKDGKKDAAGDTVATIAPTKPTTRPSATVAPSSSSATTITTVPTKETQSTAAVTVTTAGETVPSATATQPRTSVTATQPVTQEEGALLSMLTFQENYLIPAILLYVTLAAVLVTGVITALVLVRKKKKSSSDTSNE